VGEENVGRAERVLQGVVDVLLQTTDVLIVVVLVAAVEQSRR